MLLISQSQRRDSGFSAFLTRIVRHMNLHYWQDVAMLPQDILQRRCAHCIEVARANGFTYERSIAVFTANMFRINPKFYEQPAIAQLLADRNRDETERLVGLVREIKPRAWDEAERMVDAEAYWLEVDAKTADPRGEV